MKKRGAYDMNILSKIRDGLRMGKDKVVNSIVGIGSALKDKQNSLLTGLVFTSIGIGLLIYTYIPNPKQI
jgi:hypothetical protein